MAQDVDVNVRVTGLDKAAKEVNKVEESTEDLGNSFGELEGAADKFTGGAVSGLKNAAKGTKAFITGLKLTRVAIIATGIGALVVGVVALVSAFTKTQRGAEMLEKVTAGLGATLSVLTDFAASLGEMLVGAFNNPKKAITEFGSSIKTYVIDNVNRIMDGLGLLGSAIKKVFSGDFSGAMEDAKDGALSLGEGFIRLNPATAGLALAADGLVKVVKEVGPAMKVAYDAASKLSAASIQLRKDQRDLALEFAEGRAQIKEYNLIAEDTNRTLEDRLEAAQKAIDIERVLMTERQAQAAEAVRIQRETMALNESTEEDQQQLVDLEVALINIRTESAEMQTTLNNKLNIIRQQAATEAQRLHDEELARIAEREAHLQSRLESMIGHQDAIDAVLESAEYNELEAHRRKWKQIEDEAEENKEMLIGFTEAKEAAKTAIEQKYSDQREAARKKDAADELETERNLEAFKIKSTKDTLGVLMSLSETFAGATEKEQRRAFKRNKDLATAQALILTYESAVAAYRSQLTPSIDSPIRAAIAAGIATVAGLANVAKIRKTKFSGGGSVSGGGGGGGGGGDIPTAQGIGSDVGSFLVPEAAGIDLPSPDIEPVQAYVISNEISNAQALDAELAIQSKL
tara:strand:+ start:2683 stop:4575 length:1893 start_codon:yes stop_codon:yes gene_type:complete